MEEASLGVGEEEFEREMERVVVLLEEESGGVADGAGEVAQEQTLVVAQLAVLLESGLARDFEAEVSLVSLVDGGGHVVGGGSRELGLFVDQIQQPVRLLLDQLCKPQVSSFSYKNVGRECTESIIRLISRTLVLSQVGEVEVKSEKSKTSTVSRSFTRISPSPTHFPLLTCHSLPCSAPISTLSGR